MRNIGHIEFLQHAVFLQAVAQVETVTSHGRLENIQTAIQNDFPAGVSDEKWAGSLKGLTSDLSDVIVARYR